MPSLFTNSSAAKGSTRRPRGESESRRPTSHRVDNERRRAAKEVSSSSSRSNDRRSPPSARTNSAAAGIYSQPNVTQDPPGLDTASDSESSPLSPRSPEMKLATVASTTSSSSAGTYQYQLETPLSLQQYLDTEDEDATPQPKKEHPHLPPTLRRQPAMAPAPSPTPSKQEIQSRPLTPEEPSHAKDDQETVTGSPQHMSMSMPQLRRDLSQDGSAPHSPLQHRAFTPPAPMHQQSPLPQLAQPMPMYPYPVQDPRSYYTQPLQAQQLQHQQMSPHSQPMQHMQPPQGPPPPPPPAIQYMYEPRWEEQRYDLAPRQTLPMAPYYNQSPDPYRHHRLSMASAGADSQYTQDSGSGVGERARMSSPNGRPATGRTSPQDDTSDLLSRISTALPDLQLLLSRCEEVTGHHGLSHNKEQKLLTSGAGEDASGHAEALLKQKDLRIEDLEKELTARTDLHVTERNKMRFEIGNLQEQYKDLQDDLVAFKRNNIGGASPNSSKTGPDGTSSSNELQRELEASKRKSRELEEAKLVTDRLVASLEAQMRALTAELDSKKSAETVLQTRLREAAETHARERDTLVATAAAAASSGPGDKTTDGLRGINDLLAREKRDLEAALRSRDNRLEESRKIWAKDLDEARKSGAQELSELRRTTAKEKEDLAKSFEAERVAWKADVEKEARSVARKHEKALAELERGLEARFDEQYKDIEAELSKARRDYKRVKRDWHVDKERAYEERGKVREAARRMQAEHMGLIRLLEAFSEPTERDREREKKEAEREKRDAEKEKEKEKDR